MSKKKPSNVVKFDPRSRPAPRRVAAPQPEMITQKDLVQYLILKNESLSAKEDLELKEKYIWDLLEKGVPVEDGIHLARIIPALQIR